MPQFIYFHAFNNIFQHSPTKKTSNIFTRYHQFFDNGCSNLNCVLIFSYLILGKVKITWYSMSMMLPFCAVSKKHSSRPAAISKVSSRSTSPSTFKLPRFPEANSTRVKTAKSRRYPRCFISADDWSKIIEDRYCA